jgi:hypothetical protein
LNETFIVFPLDATTPTASSREYAPMRTSPGCTRKSQFSIIVPEWYAVQWTRDDRVVQQRLVGVVRNWGSTVEERRGQFPCDALVTQPYAVLFRALDVEAPVAVVFRWLCSSGWRHTATIGSTTSGDAVRDG